MNSCIRRIAVLSKFVLFAAAASAAGPETATLSSSGPVWTNSTVLPSGGAVHQGDRIRTGEDGLAVITSRAGRIEIRPGSVITWKGDGVLLESGSAASDGGAIRWSETTVRPDTAEETWFVVARNGGRSQVASYRGSVTIVAPGSAPLLLPAGSYAVASAEQGAGESSESDADAGARADEETGDSNKKKKRPAAAGGVGGKAAGGWTIGSLGHAASVALAAGVGAAATGATIAAVTLTESSPSPSE